MPVDDLGTNIVEGGKLCQNLLRVQLACRRREARDAAGQNSYQATLRVPLRHTRTLYQRLAAHRRALSLDLLRVGRRHCCDKAVAAPGDGLDAASLCPPMIENTTKRRDLDAQVIVLDDRAGPDGSYDFVLRDKIAVARDQHTKQVERARADRDGNKHPVLTPPKQTPP